MLARSLSFTFEFNHFVAIFHLDSFFLVLIRIKRYTTSFNEIQVLQIYSNESETFFLKRSLHTDRVHCRLYLRPERRIDCISLRAATKDGRINLSITMASEIQWPRFTALCGHDQIKK